MNFFTSKFLITPIIAVSAVLVFFAVDSTNMDRLCAEQGGMRDGDVCLIEVPEMTGHDSVSSEHHISILKGASQMQHNVDPDYIAIGTGSKVTWHNDDDVPVTINSDDPENQWGTDVILPDGHSTITFNNTGVYTYHGKPWIAGTIVVTEQDDGGLDSIEEFSSDAISSMRPNSMEFFYYPNPEDTENRDAFQKFILIRLPEELGGGADDVSAFRAYSTLSVGVHCQVKYWPDEGRKRLEDPCWGSMYRPIDGAMMYPYPVMNDSPLGLPYLDLSIDENGSLYVEPPVWTLNENGVVGVGRHLSLQEIRQGSQILIDSYEKTNPNHPMIPVSFAGIVLAEINSDHNRVNAKYSDFGSQYLRDISFEIRNVSAQDQQSFLNLVKFNSEFWQIGDTVIRIGGSALDANSKQPEKFRNYDVEFILDGFTYAITGSDLELLKTSLVSTYFPEHSHDDLIFVSSTVEK